MSLDPTNGLAYRFRVDCENLHGVMDVTNVSGLGNDAEVIRIPAANGSSMPHTIGIAARRITMSEANVTNREFQRRMLLALEDPTSSDARMDLTVEQLDTGEQWQIRDALVVADDTSFSTEGDSLVFTLISFEARIVERGALTSAFTPLTAQLGEVTIYLPGKIGLGLENEYRGGDTPGTEGARGAFVRGSGWQGEIEFYLTTDNGVNPEDELAKISKLARKGDNPSPQIITFTFGAESFKCRILRFKPERIHRDKTGRALIARGIIEIEEVYVDTARTSQEQKGLQIFTVRGEGYTYERIAYELWQDEQLALALMAFNPDPARQTPLVAVGTEVIVPPWDFVAQYQTRRAAPWLR